MKKITKNQLGVASLLLLIVTLTWLVYLPGLNSAHYISDVPNISPLSKYQDLSFFQNLGLYLLEGDIGPTGRPVSLATFYLNEFAWPSSPFAFIYSNILLHVINGLLVFLIIFKLAQILSISSRRIFAFSLLGTAIWMLHPLHTSMILSLSHRSIQISSLFVLLGIAFYLYGRHGLSHKQQNEWKRVLSFALLTGGVAFSVLLAGLSRESGLLLIFFILVLETFLLSVYQPLRKRLFRYYLAAFVVAPVIFIVFYLMMLSSQDYGDFTLVQRFFTETRVSFDTLLHVLLPLNSGDALVRTQYNLADLSNPWMTLPSVIAFFLVTTVGVLIRDKFPVVAFALIWFFVGHLLEALIIPQELYFGHRNYLPMLGVLIALSYYSTRIRVNYKKMSYAMSVMVVLTMIFMSSHFTLSKTDDHSKEQHLVAGIPMPEKDKKAGVTTEPAITLATYISALQKMTEMCIDHENTESFHIGYLQKTASILGYVNIPASVEPTFKILFESWKDQRCAALSTDNLLGFLNSLYQVGNERKYRDFYQLVHYWLSEIYQNQGDVNKAVAHLQQAYRLRPNIDMVITQVMYMAANHKYSDAINRLEELEEDVQGYRQKMIFALRKTRLEALKVYLNRSKKQRGHPLALNQVSY